MLPLETATLAARINLAVPPQAESPVATKRAFLMGNILDPRAAVMFPKASGATAFRIVRGESLSLVDQQLYNLLIAVAYDNLLTKEEHVIPLPRLKAMLTNRIEIVSRESADGKEVKAAIVSAQDSVELGSNRRIKESLQRLQTVLVEWNILNEDERDWRSEHGAASSQLLGSICFGKGSLNEDVLHYSFPLHLRLLLGDPKHYSLLRLRAVLSFTSAYALRLYEVLQRHADRDTKPWRLPAMSVQDVREILGVVPGKLKSFSDLRVRAIDPAVEQINMFSEFKVEVEIKFAPKRGAPVDEIVFVVKEREEPPLDVLRPSLAESRIKNVEQGIGLPADKTKPPAAQGSLPLETAVRKRVSKFAPSA